MTQEEQLLAIHEVFSPAAPVESLDVFAGREKQLLSIKKVVEEKGQHAVMYGMRGAGKTSFINLLPEIFTNLYTAKVTASRIDTFEDLWDRAVRQVKFSDYVATVGYKKEVIEEVSSLYLPDKQRVLPGDITDMFAHTQSAILFIFDEFDSIEDEKVKSQMADTLKNLSDNVPNVTVLITGIAKNIEQLLGFHPSLERCLKQIELPLLSPAEISMFLKNSMLLTQLTLPKEIGKLIVEYCTGFPHYAHLLAKFACQQAVYDASQTIEIKHFNNAVKQSIENSNHSLRVAYRLATKPTKAKNDYKDVLFTISNTPPNDNETYSPDFLLENYNTNKSTKVEFLKYNLGMLCRKERGEILVKSGRAETLRYRLKNPLMRPFIKLMQHLSS